MTTVLEHSNSTSSCLSMDTFKRRSSAIASKSANSMSEAVQVIQHLSLCRKGCLCACHCEKKSHTPAIFEQVVGKVRVGYLGLPLFSPKCDSATCKKAQTTCIRMEYWFPMRFISQIFVFQLSIERNGPEIALSFLRRVPDTAKCISFAQAGNINGFKDLFNRGLASPLDVSSTRGYSVLRVLYIIPF